MNNACSFILYGTRCVKYIVNSDRKQVFEYSSSNSTKSPRDFKSQPSARVSKILGFSFINHVMADTMYQWSSVHLGPPTCRCYKGQTAQVSQYPGRELAVSYSHFSYRCVWKGPQQYWHLHRSDCRNTLIYAHTTSRTLLTCDISLGSLTVVTPEAGDFVGSV